MSHKEDYITRYENARAEMRAILKLTQGNPTIYQPWRMKEVLDHITGWDDAVIASIKSFLAVKSRQRQHPVALTRTTRTRSLHAKPSPTK